MKGVADLCFSLNITVLKFIGVYSIENHKILHKVYGYTTYVVTMFPVAIFSSVHFMYFSNLTDFEANDFVMVAMIGFTIKFLPCLMKRNEIKKCIHYFDHFDRSLRRVEHKKIIEECISTCRRNANVYFMGCVVVLGGFSGELLMNLEELPFNMWLPNFVRENPFWFYTVQFLILSDIIYSGVFCGSIDTLMCGLCYRASAEIRVLKQSLQDNDELIFLCEDKAAESGRMFSEIKKCIRHHQLIQNFVKFYEECFSMVLFTQIMESSLIIAFLCFQLNTVLKSMTMDLNFYTFVNDLILQIFQILFYCYYGTLLMEESQTLPDAIYMSRWYEYDIQCRKALILLMEGSKKPMIITAGKLLQLTLETFTLILRRAYSLVAVLKSY
ncbi:hypothetical protein Zmor_002390 [Zophobas morio]|uniref:Odorant receptor n=1 Tax=Zophobas morio TaxID=2755281 RepID=A0AA38J0W8_9CUCU|nr:hypothetical protein Zmor_002390 [Zophobas morio]